MQTHADATAELDVRRQGTRSWPAVLSLLLLLAYALWQNVWTPADLLTAFRLVTLLWLPPAALVYSFVRRESLDATEAAVLAAASGLTLTTASYFVISTFSVRFPWLLPFWPAPIIACGVVAVLRLKAGLRQWWTSSDRFRDWDRVDWTLAALLAGSLCVTARFQRAFEPAPEAHGSRFVLNGDQTFFASIAYELQRNSPPRQHSMRAGSRDRAYHHLSHLTLALAGMASGENDLLRLHLVVVYSVMIVLQALLVFCTARSLGGGAAGWLGVWLLFIAAIPFEPSDPEGLPMFYFTLFPQASSTVEPTVLTSPQMFYGLVPANAALLSLLIAWRNARNRQGAIAAATLAAVLAALTLRFRVHCFLVLAPAVLGSLVMMACWYRRWWLLAPVGISLALVGFQMAEMRMSVYLPETQRVLWGPNGLVDDIPFYSAWPGADAVRGAVQTLLGDSELSRGAWSVVCLSLFCVCNIVGIPMTAGVLMFMRQSWHDPGKRPPAWAPLVLLAGTVAVSSIIRVGYDKHSVGGQVPFHLGWYLMPFIAAGWWPMLAWLQKRAGAWCRFLPWLVWSFTLVLVCRQTLRGASPAERKNLAESAVLSADHLATIDFVRRETSRDAVVLTNLLKPNYALWSGLAGRRTYLEYIPVGQVLDVVFLPEDRVAARLAVIRRLYTTTDEREFTALIRRARATHIVESAEFPLKVHPPDCLRQIHTSPTGRLQVWEVR